MASLRYAARYRCDGCGKIADIPPPPGDALDPPATPAGWLLRWKGDSDLRVCVDTAANVQLGDFCAGCCALPLGALLEMIRRRLGPPA